VEEIGMKRGKMYFFLLLFICFTLTGIIARVVPAQRVVPVKEDFFIMEYGFPLNFYKWCDIDLYMGRLHISPTVAGGGKVVIYHGKKMIWN
jgi:hypothetical protein